MSFACSSPAGGMLFGVSGLLLLLLIHNLKTVYLTLAKKEGKEGLGKGLGGGGLRALPCQGACMLDDYVWLLSKIGVLVAIGHEGGEVWRCADAIRTSQQP